MILQSIRLPSTSNILSSTSSYSASFPSGYPNFIPFRTVKTHHVSIKCASISQIHNYGTMDYEKRPALKWNNVYKRISVMDNPEMDVASVLNQCEKEGKTLSKWELSRIIRELRKFKRFKLALQVYEWMNNRMERFRISSSDAAIQVDLIAKVSGVSSAEECFARIPDALKDNRIYGALLNAYVGARVRDKAEHLMEQMRSKGYANHPLPYNVMMTLYMKLNEHDKVEELVSELKQKNIHMDLYSYNIWLSARGSQDSAEGMEYVFEQIKADPTINPNWTTFSTMASCYIKFGQLEKAEQCLKGLELRISNRDRMPYQFLISLYGNLGNKEEVYRIWNMYKESFPTMLNWGYHAVISSLIRVGDIEGAEKIYEEWFSAKVSYDPRIGNLLMGWYVREEPFEKALGFFDRMVATGAKPSSGSWEIIGEGHMKERRISEALTCFKEAVVINDAKNWKPKPSNVTSFVELCEKEGDTTSKEDFVALLRQLGCFEDKIYRSLLVRLGVIEVAAAAADEQLMSDNIAHKVNESGETEGEESEVLLSIVE